MSADDVEPWLRKIYDAKQREFNRKVDAVDDRKFAADISDRIDRHLAGKQPDKKHRRK